MKNLVSEFPNQLQKAIEIAKKSTLKNSSSPIQNVLIAGLGGSGIGGNIVAEYVEPTCTAPIKVVKAYICPSFTNKNTLFIASSYSGNTEETLEVTYQAHKAGAHVVCITSGGLLAEFANKNKLDLILVPAGFPPRSCLGYSLTQLLNVLYFHKLINENPLPFIANATQLLITEQESIKTEATQIAQKLKNKLPIIYTLSNEGVAVRLRQQFNENAKVLCWHHVIPEMNHNELVGWVEKHENMVVLLLRNKSDFHRNEFRYTICKNTFEKYSHEVIEITSKGKSVLEEIVYSIHLGDWISIFLAELNQVDAMNIDIINYLKSELNKK